MDTVKTKDLKRKTYHLSPYVLRFAFYIFFLTACTTPSPTSTPHPPPTATKPPIPLWLGITDSATQLETLITPTVFQQDNIVWHFVPNNESVLYTDLENGDVDAILVHTVPPDQQYWFNPIAVDGVAIIVHPDNPVTNLSLSQLQAIFNGKIQNWADVGGNDEGIMLVGRGENAGIHTTLQTRVLNEQRLAITTLIQASDQDLQTTIADTPNAIGYTTLGNLTPSVKPLAIENITPSPLTTANQTYPLTTPLYFVTLTEPVSAPRTFLAWLQSDLGQTVLGQKYGRIR